VAAYFAREIFEMAEHLLPRGLRSRDSFLPQREAEVARLREALTQSPIYAFDRTALRVASDLRIGSAERLSDLLEALAREDRTVFLEARGEDLDDILVPDLEMVSRSWVEDSYFGDDVDLVGYEVRIEAGLITIHPYTICSTEFVEMIEKDSDWGRWPERARRRAFRLERFSDNGSAIEIDPRRPVVGREEFLKMLAEDATRPPDLSGEGFEDERGWVAGTDSSSERRRRLEHVRWIHRFRSMVSTREFDSDLSWPRIPNAAHASIVASLLTVIEAMGDGIGLKHVELDRDARRHRRAGRDRSGDHGEAKQSSLPGAISVVTINLADDDLRAAYGAPGTPREVGAPATGLSPGRARHLVRGHLFLARNGKMTWRRPHWRGQLEKPRITKLVAWQSDRRPAGI